MGVADELGVDDVCRILGRSEASVRRFRRFEGLPFRKVGRGPGRLVIARAELDEWAARPEIAEMLAQGERLKGAARAGC